MGKKSKKGFLVVVDGADGSGKATQVSILVNRLQKEKRRVKTIDFPRYEHNFFGELIGRCLSGEYGDFLSIDPHIASVLYAADRFESKKKIEEWLQNGYIVVCDRYVSANQMHQGGKIHSYKKRKEFLQWLNRMEFGIFQLPRPDLILYLDVPREVSDELLSQKKQGISQNRFVRGKKDVAESNHKHLDDSRKSAMKLVQENNTWVKITCTRKKELLSREIIAEMVWNEVAKVI